MLEGIVYLIMDFRNEMQCHVHGAINTQAAPASHLTFHFGYENRVATKIMFHEPGVMPLYCDWVVFAIERWMGNSFVIMCHNRLLVRQMGDSNGD
jgi:hypothetical protein